MGGGWKDDDSSDSGAAAWDLDKGSFPFSALGQPIVGRNQTLDKNLGLHSNELSQLDKIRRW